MEIRSRPMKMGRLSGQLIFVLMVGTPAPAPSGKANHICVIHFSRDGGSKSKPATRGGAGLLSQHVRLEKDENSSRQTLLNFPGRSPYFREACLNAVQQCGEENRVSVDSSCAHVAGALTFALKFIMNAERIFRLFTFVHNW